MTRKFGPGFICFWHSSLGSIPVGYVVCDGENGTPDLRAKMIFGAGTTPVGETGGNLIHQHDFTSDIHRHDFEPVLTDIPIGNNFDEGMDTTVATGTTAFKLGMPPFYVLYAIMEL